MTMANSTNNPICSNGAIALIMDFSTTCRPVVHNRIRRINESREKLLDIKYLDMHFSLFICKNPKKKCMYIAYSFEEVKNFLIGKNCRLACSLILYMALYSILKNQIERCYKLLYSFYFSYLLGMPETSLRGLSTRIARNVRRSTVSLS